MRVVDIKRRDDEIVERLKDLIKLAEDGKIKEISVCWIDEVNNPVMMFSGDCGDAFRVFGSMEFMKQRYYEQVILPYCMDE